MKKKTLALILTLCMAVTGAVCFAAGAAAAGGLQAITAYLNSGITIKLDGEAQVLTDASGVRTYPISYNGTTYLPIRSIAQLLGVDVGWDQATASVLLGQTKKVDLIDTYKAYHFGDEGSFISSAGQVQTAEGKTEDISGVSCSHWLYFTTGFRAWEKATASASFNLLGEHDTLTFSYYSNNDATLTVLGDNDYVLGEFPITGGAVAKTVTIPLLKTSELKFQMDMSGEDAQARIFNAYLDAEK